MEYTSAYPPRDGARSGRKVSELPAVGAAGEDAALLSPSTWRRPSSTPPRTPPSTDVRGDDDDADAL